MDLICCFAQRQDGCVAGLVDINSDKEPDLSTSRFVTSPVDSEMDNKEQLARDVFEKATNIRSRDVILFAVLDTPDGRVYVMDMDVIRPMSPKTGDPNVIVSWINPWHLAMGQHGDVARQVFELNETRVAEPPKYLFRKNTEFVPDPNAPADDQQNAPDSQP